MLTAVHPARLERMQGCSWEMVLQHGSLGSVKSRDMPCSAKRGLMNREHTCMRPTNFVGG